MKHCPKLSRCFICYILSNEGSQKERIKLAEDKNHLSCIVIIKVSMLLHIFLSKLQPLWSCGWGAWADRDHRNSGDPTVVRGQWVQPRGATITTPPSHHPSFLPSHLPITPPSQHPSFPPSLLPTVPPSHHPSFPPSLPAVGGSGWEGAAPAGTSTFLPPSLPPSLLPSEPDDLFSERKQIFYFAKNVVWVWTRFSFHSGQTIHHLCSSCPYSVGEVSEMPQQWGNGIRGKNLRVNILDGQFLTSP